MTIKEQITDSLKRSISGADKIWRDTCRMLLNELMTFEKSGKGSLTDEIAIKLIQTYKKKVVEERDIAHQHGMATRETNAIEELLVIQTFLPVQLTDDELNEMIRSAVTQITSENNGTKNLQGLVIGKVKALAQGRADGKRISDAVKNRVAAITVKDFENA